MKKILVSTLIVLITLSTLTTLTAKASTGSFDSLRKEPKAFSRILRSGGTAVLEGDSRQRQEKISDFSGAIASSMPTNLSDILERRRVEPAAPSSYRYVMCRDVDADNNPSGLTPSFVTSDYRACENVEWYTDAGDHALAMKWFYRTGDTSWEYYGEYTWNGYLNAGYWLWSSWIYISGYWPASNPSAWKAEFYDNGVMVSKDYCEITESQNPGDSTMCKDVQESSPWDPIDRTSTFRRDVDTKACAWFRWDDMYYFYEPDNTCHWVKYEWIDPSGSIVRTATYYFRDYADDGDSKWGWGKSWDCLPITTSTPKGDWQVNVYLDKFLWDGSFPTWYKGFEGPMFTLSFTVTEGENTPPVLSGGHVTPTSGYPNAEFTFEVTYTDSDGDNPGDRKHVYVYDSKWGWQRFDMDYVSGSPSTGMLFRKKLSGPTGGWSVNNHDYFFHFNDIYAAEAYYPPDGTYLTFSVIDELYSLPAGSKSTDPYNPILDDTKLLKTISLNGGGQSITVNPDEIISVDCTYQLWSPSNPTEWDQLFFIYSWTPSWPPPGGYYHSVYDAVPGLYPGYEGSDSFSLNAPTTDGTYYLYWCSGAEYGMELAVSHYDQPLNTPAHAKIVVISGEPSIRIEPLSLSFEFTAGSSSANVPRIDVDTFAHHITIDTEFAGLILEQESDFTRVTSLGCEQNLKLGNPVLPAKSFFVLLPPNTNVMSITTLAFDRVDIPGKYQIEYFDSPDIVQPSDRLSVQLLQADISSFRSYPEEVCSVGGIRRFRGYSLLSLTVFGAVYHPKSQRLTQNNVVTVILEVENRKTTDQKTESLFRGIPVDRTLVSSMVVNPDVARLYQSKSNSETTSTYEYVIITSSDLSSAFQPLIDWKIQKLGSATTVTVSWINTNYAGTDLQEKIRNFIKDAYSTWQTEWVLLGGDIEIVPYRGAYGNIEPLVPATNNIACDLYYSDLDGSWDANGNGIYGEVADNVDMYPDVYVGRAPVNTVVEATNFVNKVFTYEQSPPYGYLTKALLIAYWLDSSTNEAALKDYIANNYLAGYSITKVYEASHNAGIDKSAVINAFNSGQGLVNQAAHGNPSWFAPLGTSDVDSLNNGKKLFIAYSMACLTNKFEDSDAISEHFILNTQGGAVAYVGNSREGIYYVGNPGNGPSDQYDKEFFKYLSQGYKHIGETLARSKVTFISQSGSDGYFRWIQYCLNLLGDPEMTIHTEEFGKTLSVYNDGDADLDVTDIGKRYASGEATGWLFASPNEFAVPPSSIPQEVTGTVNPTGLSPDTYHAWLQFYSNDPIYPPDSPYEVPVTLTVIDNTPPETTITSGPSGTINYIDVSFGWIGSDDTTPASGLVYSYYLIGHDSDWSSWTSATSKEYYGLPDNVYTFKVKAKDQAGNVDPTPAERSFAIDATPPTIVDHAPAGVNVPITVAITVTFSESMDKLSAQNAFSISPTVSGSFSWTGNEMIFTPDSDLECDTTYTVTVGTQAMDLASNNMEASYSWQFTTLRTTDNLYLVVRGYNNKIYHRTYNSSSGSWDGWNVLPTGSTCDRPASAVCCGRLHMVVRGLSTTNVFANYTLWYGWVNLTDNSFSGWTRLSGSTPSAPTLASHDDSLILTVRGLNNRIYYRSYDCVSHEWGGWTALPSGKTCDSPAATILHDTLHIVVRGFSITSVSGNRSLWHSSVNLTTEVFSAWTRLSGSTQSAPTLTSSQTLNSFCLVVRGLNSRIYYNTWNGSVWEGWIVLPSGRTCDSPAATMMGDELHIVVRGMSGTSIWHYYIDLSTSDHSSWTRTSGATPSAPTLTS